MTVSLTHPFQSSKPDGSDLTQVQPSNWNAEHDITLIVPALLGNTAGADGPVESLSTDDNLALIDGLLTPNPEMGTFAWVKTSIIVGTRTLANQTALQPIFPAAQDAIALEANSTYLFSGCLVFGSMRTNNADNASMNILGAGTATLASIRWMAYGRDANPNTAGAYNGAMYTAAASGANLFTGATNANMSGLFRGILRTANAGTLIPSIALTDAIAAVVQANTWFSIYKIGDGSFVSSGGWQ